MDVLVAGIGLAVGVFFGLFGAGASAFATPVLALAGVPALAAVASPLPATLPASAAAAWSYIRRRELHWPTVRLALAGAMPATIGGALLSQQLGGPVLLALSAVLLAVLGALLVRRPHPATSTTSGSAVAAAPTRRGGLVVAASALVGLLTGLLANGGGFLLVPLFLLVVGLGLRQAAGSSLVTAAVLSVPTLVAHTMLGDIDWAVAGLFAVGLIPGSALGGALAARVPAGAGQRVFGVTLVALAAVFLARQLT